MAIKIFPNIPIERALNGLGINLGSKFNEEWVYKEAKDAGCTEVRYQISWSSVEDFENPGVFDLSSMNNSLEWCAKYELRPLIVAAYAPPWITVRTVVVSGEHPVGSTTINTTTSTSDFQPGRDHIGGAWYESSYFNKQAYYGAIIHNVSGTSIQLGAATKSIIPNGTVLSVNRLLYPSVDAVSGTVSAEKFADYVEALANKLASAYLPLGGRIEIWNEPPWVNDTWDNRSYFYDNPAAMGIATWTFTVQPLINALVDRNIPEGIGLVNGGTNKSGGHGVLRYLTPTQIANSSIIADAIHSYGTYPEYHWWHNEGAGHNWGVGYVNLDGASNFAFNKKLQMDNPTAGLEYVITEAGAYIDDDEVKRSYDLRHLVGAWSMGINMVNFYSIADSPPFHMVSSTTQIRRPVWEDIRRLMRIITWISKSPTSYALPNIASWEGTDWDLAVFSIGPLLIIYKRPIPLANGIPIWPSQSRVKISDAPGDLCVLGANDREHQLATQKTVFVDANPLILTRIL